MKKTNYFGVLKEDNGFYTKSLVPQQIVYGEKIIGEYRQWASNRSKLCAAMHKNLRVFPFKSDSIILYLGASSGTTCSHISDIVTNGMIFGVDLAPRIFYKFIELSKTRPNLYPIMASANHVEKYAFVPKCDVVFQDIAQRDQLRIFNKNIDIFLKKDGVGMLVVKARSIDTNKEPKLVFKQIRHELNQKYKIVDERGLAPYEKDHMMFVIKQK